MTDPFTEHSPALAKKVRYTHIFDGNYFTKVGLVEYFEEILPGNPDSFKNLSLASLDDKDIVLKAIEITTSPEDLIRHASQRLLGDPHFMLKAAEHNWRTLAHASDELCNDRDFMLLVIRINWNAISFASERLRSNRAFALAVVEICGIAYTKLPAFYKDKEVTMNALDCLNQPLKSLRGSPPEILRDEQIMTRAIQRIGCMEMENVMYPLNKDRNFILRACQTDGGCLAYAPEWCRDDKEVVLAAVGQFGLALRRVSLRLRQDKEVVLRAVGNFALAVEYAAPWLCHDFDVLKVVYTQNGRAWQLLHRRNRVGLQDNPKLLATAIRFAHRHKVDWVEAFDFNHSKSVKSMAHHLARYVAKSKKEPGVPQPSDWDGAVFVRFANSTWKRDMYHKLWLVRVVTAGPDNRVIPDVLYKKILAFLPKEEHEAANALVKYSSLLASITISQGMSWRDFARDVSRTRMREISGSPQGRHDSFFIRRQCFGMPNW